MNGISWTHFYVAIVTFGHKFNVANVDLSLVRQVQSLRMFPEDLNRCWERYLWTKKKELDFSSEMLYRSRTNRNGIYLLKKQGLNLENL